MPRISRLNQNVLASSAALVGLGLASCATITGENVQTELLVANHTPDSITVAFEQSPENGPRGNYAVEQQVLPTESIRFSGKQGDTLIVNAPGQPPMTLVFARRSQTIKIVDTIDGPTAQIRQGYTDPSRP